MNVLVLGKGGREHALAWSLARSPQVKKLYVAPGNAGTYEIAENIAVEPEDFEKIGQFVQEKHIDLTVVGPEKPLVAGLVDYFQTSGLVQKGHKIFGPSQKAAQIEGSKVFAKRLMQKYNIPTAQTEIFENAEEANNYLESNSWTDNPLVVKADGLAEGKGVILPKDKEEAKAAVQKIMVQKAFGQAGAKILLEEKIVGEEASILALTDGKTLKLLASSQDHKAIFNEDKGPNTGGMGAYAPAPIISPEIEKRVYDEILVPIIQGLTQEGTPYIGCLYAGLMITNDGPKVLEFNCRFGDPEAQPVLALLESDLVELLKACLEGELENIEIKNKVGAACCVVMTSQGYPGNYEKGKVITGLENVPEDVYVFHAGTKKENEKIITAGGRVLGVTGLGPTIRGAIQKAYQGVSKISWEGEYHRRDIGQKALKKVKS